MVKELAKLSIKVNYGVEKLVIALTAVLTVLTTLGVITRYLFGIPIIWLYETTLVVFVWTAFLGVSVAFKYREHIGLDFFVNCLPPNMARWVRIFILLMVAAFLVIGVIEGAEIVKMTASKKYNTINLSTAWFYASFPVSAAISLLHVIVEGLNVLLGREATGSDADARSQGMIAD